MTVCSLRVPRLAPRLIRLGLLGAVIGLTAWLLSISWMRWMDPFIDFGRELYLPWRVLAGEHPGRDFVHPYGPLSVYFNAGVFAVFGVSIRALIIANLAVFAAITVELFALSRRAFGFLPAAAATLVYVAVFAFEHYWGVNNYTYAAPYSHEATHGMALLLALLLWVTRRNLALPFRRGRDAAITGVLCGLCCLTKTEYVVVSAAIWGMTTVRLARGTRARPTGWVGGSVAGFIAVLALAWLLLQLALPAGAAARSATNAIVAPFTYREYSTSTHVLHFLGADRLAENFGNIARWSGWTLAVFVGLAGLSAAAVFIKGKLARPTAAVVAAIFGVWIALRVDWVFCGSAFPLLLLAGGAGLAWGRIRGGKSRAALTERSWTQALYYVAAVGLLARMALDPTISHYGFFQAMLAATWITGWLLVELPRLAKVTAARATWRIGIVALVAGGALLLVRRSAQFYALKQEPIGVGADRIYGYVPSVYPLPAMWERARQQLEKASSSSLLVVPEGLALNYWTKRRQPLSLTDVLPATLRLARQPPIETLSSSPPDQIVLVSREMGEFGLSNYGGDEATGQLIGWIRDHYGVEAGEGPYPFATSNTAGIWILGRKN